MVRSAHGRAVELDRALVGAVEAGEDLGELGAPGPGQSADAEDLAPPGLEVDTVEEAEAGQAPDAQPDIADGALVRAGRTP